MMTTTKQTELPSEWSLKRFDQIIDKAVLGGNYENSEANEGVPVIKMGNIERGKINIEKVQYLPINSEYNKNDVLKKGDLLFNTRNTLDLVGKVSIWNNELPLAIYNSNLLKLEFKKEEIESNFFMNYVFNSNQILGQLRARATGTTSVAAIYVRDLNSIKIPLPPLPEQRAIAHILSTWDRAIQTTQALIVQKEQEKKWLMQNLLTGKKRLKGFSGEWKTIHIKDFAKEVSIKNKSNQEQTVLSCTKYDGLVPSLEYFGRKIYSDDLSSYKIVPKGHFAYATNHIEEGSIGYQDLLSEAMISPMYTVFKTDEDINDIFLYRLLKSHDMVSKYQARMEGSIDRRGGLRWDAFSIIKVKIPSIEEQTAIAQVLQTADKEIELLKTKLEQQKLQKKGLMQVLLTGKVRVKTTV